MWRLGLVVLLLAAGCSGDDEATPSPPSTTTTVPTSTTTTTTPSTTTSSSTTSSTTTTTTAPTPGFSPYTHQLFTAEIPDSWSENPDFPAFGAGFREDHTSLALPPTSLDISFEEQEAGFDLDAHIQRLQDDLAAFVPNFRVLESGQSDIDGARSLWFQYAEEFDGFPIIVREEAGLRDSLLVTFTLISPVEFFEFDEGQLQQVLRSYRFS